METYARSFRFVPSIVMASLIWGGSWGCGAGKKAAGPAGSGGAGGSAQDGGGGAGSGGSGGGGSAGSADAADAADAATGGTEGGGGGSGADADAGSDGDTNPGDAAIEGAAAEVGAGISYSGCMFVGGINRFVIAKRDAPRNLCVVLVLDSPGANPFNLTLPANWGMEFAFAMPAESNCLRRFPPAGALEASGGMGTVTLPPTPQPTANVDVTLTFPPGDAGAGASERLMANGVLGPLGCP